MNNTVRTVQLPDESQVRDEVEQIAAGPLAELRQLCQCGLPVPGRKGIICGENAGIVGAWA